jgi:hypothetical protein
MENMTSKNEGCSLLVHSSCKNRFFGGTYHHHHQVVKNQIARNNFSCNYQVKHTGSNHWFTSQNTAFFIVTASDLTWLGTVHILLCMHTLPRRGVHRTIALYSPSLPPLRCCLKPWNHSILSSSFHINLSAENQIGHFPFYKSSMYITLYLNLALLSCFLHLDSAT